MSQSSTFIEDSFYNSTLVELDTFNNILYNEIENKYRWMRFIEFPNFLFILFPLLLLVAFIFKKNSNRKLLLTWEVEEFIEDQLQENDKNDIN